MALKMAEAEAEKQTAIAEQAKAAAEQAKAIAEQERARTARMQLRLQGGAGEWGNLPHDPWGRETKKTVVVI